MNASGIKILMVGDVMLGRLVNDVLDHEAAAYPWGDTLPLFHGADWRVCNLECVISDRGSPWMKTPKVFHFRSGARNMAVLHAANINAVSLANNHTLDFDVPALFDTLELLDHAGIEHSGAGENIEAASHVAVAEVSGIRIGLLSFTDNEPGWAATEQRPGVFYVPVEEPDDRTNLLLQSVDHAKEHVDFLIVAAHWGSNWGWRAPDEHIALAHQLIEAGANVVFGHSPHVFRGIEFHLGHPIIYSAGDFVDDYAVDPDDRNDWSFIFFLDVNPNEPARLHLYPTVIRSFQAHRAGTDESKVIAGKMADLCAPFGTRAIWNKASRCLDIGAHIPGERSPEVAKFF